MNFPSMSAPAGRADLPLVDVPQLLRAARQLAEVLRENWRAARAWILILRTPTELTPDDVARGLRHLREALPRAAYAQLLFVRYLGDVLPRLDRQVAAGNRANFQELLLATAPALVKLRDRAVAAALEAAATADLDDAAAAQKMPLVQIEAIVNRWLTPMVGVLQAAAGTTGGGSDGNALAAPSKL